MTNPSLPENAVYGDDGLLYHKVTRMTEGGSERTVYRRLATTLAEARDQRLDFYHPTLGLIWEGYKLAADREPEDIMRDISIGGFRRPGNASPPFPVISTTESAPTTPDHAI